MNNQKYVLFKQNNVFCLTTPENYIARYRDANKITKFSKFNDIDEILDYLAKYTKINIAYIIVKE